MAVLKNVKSEWRLFWTLETIGFSYAVALFGIAVKGYHVDNPIDDDETCNNQNRDSLYVCGIYSWPFIFVDHPVAVTSFSLLVSSFSFNGPCLSLCPGETGLEKSVFVSLVIFWVVWPLVREFYEPFPWFIWGLDLFVALVAVLVLAAVNWTRIWRQSCIENMRTHMHEKMGLVKADVGWALLLPVITLVTALILLIIEKAVKSDDPDGTHLANLRGFEAGVNMLIWLWALWGIAVNVSSPPGDPLPLMALPLGWFLATVYLLCLASRDDELGIRENNPRELTNSWNFLWVPFKAFLNVLVLAVLGTCVRVESNKGWMFWVLATLARSAFAEWIGIWSKTNLGGWCV